MKKIIVLTMAVLTLGSLTLTGCKKEAPVAADQVAVAIFNMVLKDDASSAAELFGFTSEEEARQALGMEDGLYKTLANQLVSRLSVYGFTVSGEEVQKFTDAFISMFSGAELTAKVKELDEKAGTAVVTCTVNTFDPEDLSRAVASLDPSLLEGGDGVLGPVLEAMSDAISGIKPTGGTADFDVDFELASIDVNGETRKVWVPRDAAQFGSQISNAAMAG